MRAVLMSIQPKWVELIASGKKTVEVRKTAPKIETPFKVYMYCTSVKNMNLNDYVQIHRKTRGMVDDWNGKVVAEFTCDKIDRYVPILFKGQNFYQGYMDEEYKACVSHQELCEYAKGKTAYGWHISELKVYDQPKELSEFIRPSNGCCNEGKCNGCKFLDKGIDGIIEDDCLADFDTDSYSILRRPPQSWQFVEELKYD